MTITYLNQQRDRSYEGSKAKGFWDKPRNAFEAIALTIGELYEALEAHRKGRHADVEIYKGLSINNPNTVSLEDVKALFEKHIKDTVGDELADAFIRLMDYCGGFQISFNSYKDSDSLYDPHPKWPANFGEGILLVNEYLLKALRYSTGKPEDMHTVFHYYTEAAAAILYFARFHDIDVIQHVDMKLAYNATRERLHGKTY